MCVNYGSQLDPSSVLFNKNIHYIIRMEIINAKRIRYPFDVFGQRLFYQ